MLVTIRNTKRQQVCDTHTVSHRVARFHFDLCATVVGRRGFVHFGATVNRLNVFSTGSQQRLDLLLIGHYNPIRRQTGGGALPNADIKSTLFRCGDQQSRRGETGTGSRFVKATAVIFRSIFNRLNRLWFYAASAENTTTQPVDSTSAESRRPGV